MVGVLVTGATGAVGSEVVRALKTAGVERISCLVRPRGKIAARERLSRAVGRAGLADSTFVEVIEGDVAAPLLGLSQERYDELAERIDIVIHAAADVRLGAPLEMLRLTNVQGTEHVLDFARACRRGKGAAARVCYVGTAYVAGRRTGIVEEDDLSDRFGFKNGYEESKYEAERLVRSQWDDVPTVICRPSIVWTCSSTGEVNRRSPIYPMLRLLAGWDLPIYPAYSTTYDFVSVDYVARAIVALALSREHAGRCFHLASGSEDDLAFRDFVRVLFRAFGRRAAPVPVSIWNRVLRPLLERARGEEARAQDLIFSRYRPYAVESNPRFSVREARRHLPDLHGPPSRALVERSADVLRETLTAGRRAATS